jgi:predicted transcriptional regulator
MSYRRVEGMHELIKEFIRLNESFNKLNEKLDIIITTTNDLKKDIKDTIDKNKNNFGTII